jgi:hypothetical protein
MTAALIVVGTMTAVFGIPTLAVFGIPWAIVNWPRLSHATPKTAAAILAKAMSHPATICDWTVETRRLYETYYVNERMGVRLRRDWYSGTVQAGFPVSWADQKRLNYAAKVIDARLEDLRKQAAVNAIAEKLSTAYGDPRNNVFPIGSAKQA